MISTEAQKLLRDIRSGKIATAREAAQRHKVSSNTIWTRVAQLRAAGYEIATAGVERWRLLGEPRG